MGPVTAVYSLLLNLEGHCKIFGLDVRVYWFEEENATKYLLVWTDGITSCLMLFGCKIVLLNNFLVLICWQLWISSV